MGKIMARVEMDPVRLGNLEVGWWRAHNEKNKSRMAQFLVEQNVALYGFTLEEAREELTKIFSMKKLNQNCRKWSFRS